MSSVRPQTDGPLSPSFQGLEHAVALRVMPSRTYRERGIQQKLLVLIAVEVWSHHMSILLDMVQAVVSCDLNQANPPGRGGMFPKLPRKRKRPEKERAKERGGGGREKKRRSGNITTYTALENVDTPEKGNWVDIDIS